MWNLRRKSCWEWDLTDTGLKVMISTLRAPFSLCSQGLTAWCPDRGPWHLMGEVLSFLCLLCAGFAWWERAPSPRITSCPLEPCSCLISNQITAQSCFADRFLWVLFSSWGWVWKRPPATLQAHPSLFLLRCQPLGIPFSHPLLDAPS